MRVWSYFFWIGFHFVEAGICTESQEQLWWSGYWSLEHNSLEHSQQQFRYEGNRAQFLEFYWESFLYKFKSLSPPWFVLHFGPNLPCFCSYSWLLKINFSSRNYPISHFLHHETLCLILKWCIWVLPPYNCSISKWRSKLIPWADYARKLLQFVKFQTRNRYLWQVANAFMSGRVELWLVGLLKGSSISVDREESI